MFSRKIVLGGIEFTVVDLTNPLKLDQEVYPGDPKPIRKLFTDIDKTGFHHYIHEIGDHHFQPHGDAPNHQNPEMTDQGFEKFDLAYSFNAAFMIDLSDTPGAVEKKGVRFKAEVTRADLQPFEHLFRQKNAVLIRTGYDSWLEKNHPHDPAVLPYLDAHAARYIASFENIRVFGTDSLTVDPDGSHVAHQMLKEKLIVEAMVHLHLIPQGKRENFDLQTAAVRIVGATGGPVVAYAFIR